MSRSSRLVLYHQCYAGPMQYRMRAIDVSWQAIYWLLNVVLNVIALNILLAIIVDAFSFAEGESRDPASERAS